MNEINNCCGTTCDKPKAIKEQEQLRGHLKAIVAAFDETQSDKMLVSIEGFEKLHKAIMRYKEYVKTRTE